MTLVELLCAIACMTIIIGALGILANGVQENFQHGEAYGTATQHAARGTGTHYPHGQRSDRRAAFPGFLVLSTTDSGYQFPDTVAVWHPSGTPANPGGLPLYGELVVYCYDLNNPNQLLEITNPTDTRTVPAITNLTDWASNILAMRQSQTARRWCLPRCCGRPVQPARRRCGGYSGSLRGSIR